MSKVKHPYSQVQASKRPENERHQIPRVPRTQNEVIASGYQHLLYIHYYNKMDECIQQTKMKLKLRYTIVVTEGCDVMVVAAVNRSTTATTGTALRSYTCVRNTIMTILSADG
jgi:hypothetical protein